MGTVAKLYQLEDHIRETDYRFQKLLDRADQIHDRLDRLEELVVELKEMLKKN